MVISREDRIDPIDKSFASIQSTVRSGGRLQERVHHSRIRDVNGATDRGVVRLGSHHHLCGSESVAY